MKAFLSRPSKRKLSPELVEAQSHEDDNEPTEVKLAILASLHPEHGQDLLLDVLLAHEGSVTDASASLKATAPSKKGSGVIGYQQSLKQFAVPDDAAQPATKKLKSKKGSTLHLYDPEDVAEHTPCTIIHNFLPADEANELLKELLVESKTYKKITFKMFENVVSSPHTSSFYVESYDEIRAQMTDFYYNGGRLSVSPQACMEPLLSKT